MNAQKVIDNRRNQVSYACNIVRSYIPIATIKKISY